MQSILAVFQTELAETRSWLLGQIQSEVPNSFGVQYFHWHFQYTPLFCFFSLLVPNIHCRFISIELTAQQPPKEVCFLHKAHHGLLFLRPDSPSLGTEMTQRKHQTTITSFPTEHKHRVHSAQAGRRQNTSPPPSL